MSIYQHQFTISECIAGHKLHVLWGGPPCSEQASDSQLQDLRKHINMQDMICMQIGYVGLSVQNNDPPPPSPSYDRAFLLNQTRKQSLIVIYTKTITTNNEHHTV